MQIRFDFLWIGFDAVRICPIGVASWEFDLTSWEFDLTSREFDFTSYEFDYCDFDLVSSTIVNGVDDLEAQY